MRACGAPLVAILGTFTAAACGHLERSVTTAQLLALVRDTPRREGYATCAVLDADETLWGLDLSTTLVRRALDEQVTTEGGRVAMNDALRTLGLPEAPTARDAAQVIDAAFESGALHEAGRRRGLLPDEVNLLTWPHYNWLFVGLTPASLSAFAAELTTTPEFRDQVFAGMRVIIAALRHRGWRVVVISGGVHEFVVAGAAELGFAPVDVRGLQVSYQDGVLTPEVIEPIPYKDGKATIALAMCGGRPMLAFGDSVASGDAAMLDLAAVAVAVRPRAEHLRRARERQLLIYSHPEQAGVAKRRNEIVDRPKF